MHTKSIHTLDARDHIMLEFIRDYFDLSPRHIFREIQSLRCAVENALKLKGISYDALKSSLVPDRQRREIALVFDSTIIQSAWYGKDIFQRLIPLFDRMSNHSILVGDYLDRPGQAEQIFSAFAEAVNLKRNVEFKHPTQFYIVYINNLTDVMIERFDEGLKGYDAYVGFADMTYISAFKIYLSTMLVNMCIKHGKVIIQGHEPDCDDAEDINICGYPFEENGFECRSISEDLMGVMLSYKIERPTFPGFESDTLFSLNAVSLLPLPLDDFEIQVDDAKLEYLRKVKTGSMSRSGLTAVNSNQLAAIIRSKVTDSYIYNMSFNSEHNIVKFNIILEINANQKSGPTRLLAALDYRPEDKILRLITLY